MGVASPRLASSSAARTRPSKGRCRSDNVGCGRRVLHLPKQSRHGHEGPIRVILGSRIDPPYVLELESPDPEPGVSLKHCCPWSPPLYFLVASRRRWVCPLSQLGNRFRDSSFRLRFLKRPPELHYMAHPLHPLSTRQSWLAPASGRGRRINGRSAGGGHVDTRY